MMKNAEKIAVQIVEIIRRKGQESGKTPILVAIDGRCASGKTTLAAELRRLIACEVVHMDHFFLRPEMRTDKRLETPGENVDHERFLQEVLLPMYRGEEVSFRPFDCKKGDFGEVIRLKKQKIYIIEGAYACHESLREYYDLCIFVDVSPQEQMRRIIARNGEETAENFRSKWIPLEERYFKAFDIAGMCDYRFIT